MKRSWPSRLCSALLGVWFVTSIVAEPISMGGPGMTGMSMVGMTMTGMNMSAMDMSAMDMSAMETSNTDTSNSRAVVHAPRGSASSHATATGEEDNDGALNVVGSGEQKQDQKDDSRECKQHDCCCSAISPSLLTPEAALSWLPAHVIDQVTPSTGEWVVHTEGQVRLPFANGPPSAVIV